MAASAVRRVGIGGAALKVLLMGCATLGSSLESRGETRFDEGVEALARGDYRLAHERLSWVAQRYGHEGVGQRALLTLASLEIDPRNPNRRINVGTDLAAS